MEKMKQESKVKKPLKIWQGVLTLLVSAIILFVAAPILLSPFGMYGSLLGELLLLGVAVGAVLLFRGDLREVFPLKKPHFSGNICQQSERKAWKMGSTVDQWLHFRDVPRRCFSIFSDGDRWGDDGISVVGNRKHVL